MYPTILIASLAIMLASLSGKLVTWGLIGRWLTPRMRYLVALAGGVFAVIVYGLIEEALHEGGLVPMTIGAFLLGGVLLEGVTRLLPKGTHHHHGPHPEHTHGRLDARRMLLGDAVHNVHDGLALVPAFLVSPAVGIGTAVGIFLHEVVQEIAEFFVLREAGYTVRSALVWNFAVSATLLIGVAVSATLASVEFLHAPLIAFSAGGFTYVLLRDLLPSAIMRAQQDRQYGSYVGMFLVGVLIMLTVTVLFPHEEHEEEELPLPEGFGLVHEGPTTVA